MKNEQELLTIKEAALFLRTSTAAAYNLVARGQMPGVVRLGRRVLIRAKDLRAHVGLLPPRPSGSAARKVA